MPLNEVHNPLQGQVVVPLPNDAPTQPHDVPTPLLKRLVPVLVLCLPLPVIMGRAIQLDVETQPVGHVPVGTVQPIGREPSLCWPLGSSAHESRDTGLPIIMEGLPTMDPQSFSGGTDEPNGQHTCRWKRPSPLHWTGWRRHAAEAGQGTSSAHGKAQAFTGSEGGLLPCDTG